MGPWSSLDSAMGKFNIDAALLLHATSADSPFLHRTYWVHTTTGEEAVCKVLDIPTELTCMGADWNALADAKWPSFGMKSRMLCKGSICAP